jgi:hypothetical protein
LALRRPARQHCLSTRAPRRPNRRFGIGGRMRRLKPAYACPTKRATMHKLTQQTPGRPIHVISLSTGEGPARNEVSKGWTCGYGLCHSVSGSIGRRWTHAPARNSGFRN